MTSIQTSEQIATIRRFAPVFTPMLTIRPFRCHPSSAPLFLIHRDGTDPLFGGHQGGSADRDVIDIRLEGTA
jgi:hypothetical protein